MSDPRAPGFAKRVVLSFCLTGSAGLLALTPAAGASSFEPSPDRSAEVVEGRQSARVLVPPGVPIVDYDNEGYRLRRLSERDDGSIEIEVETWAVADDSAQAEWQPPTPVPATMHSVPAVERLTGALTARLTDPDERARRLTSWVARNIDYRLDRSRSQSAEAVLERRDAYCTGAARLLVALLEVAGLEAREVPGFAVEGTTTSPPGLHRWVEYRPSGGPWRFVDPLATFGFVPATFVRLPSERLPMAALEQPWKLLGHVDGLIPIAQDPAFPVGIRTVATARMRPDGARVHVHVPTDRSADVIHRVVLRGPWIRERTVQGNGEAVFAAVAPGAYDVRVERLSETAAGTPLSVPVRHRSFTVSRRQAVEGLVLNIDLSPERTVDARASRRSGASSR